MERKKNWPNRGSLLAYVILATALLSAATFHLCVWLPVHAATGGSGSLRGTVVNGTTGQTVADWPVEVWGWNEPEPILVATGASDANGTFEFIGLDAENASLFRVQTTYRDVTYASDTVALSSGQGPAQVQLLVYETTDRADSIVVNRFHFVVLAREPGSVSVLEMYQFGNTGSQTYVGGAAVDGGRQSVSVALPADAFGLVLQNDSLVEKVALADNQLVTVAPIAPGETTLDLAFSYRLPIDGSVLDLSWRPEYRISQVNGLILDQGLELASETLTHTGDLTVDGQVFQQYEGGGIQPGDTVSIRLFNVPATQGDTQPPSAAVRDISLPLSSGTTRWLIVGVGVILFAVGLSYPRWSRVALGHAEEGVGGVKEREQLLHLLAQLDDARAAGLLDESVYQQLREEHKARLLAIWPVTAERAEAAHDRGA